MASSIALPLVRLHDRYNATHLHARRLRRLLNLRGPAGRRAVGERLGRDAKRGFSTDEGGSSWVACVESVSFMLKG